MIAKFTSLRSSILPLKICTCFYRRHLLLSLSVVGFVSLLGCSEESRFQAYLEDIGSLTLPFYVDNLGKSIPQKDFDLETYRKYKVSWGYEPAGYLKVNDSLYMVLEYSLNKMGYLPYLVSFNQKGQKIDSLELFRFSEEAPRFRVTESAFIYGDKIEMTQTHSTFRRNKSGEILKKGFYQREKSYVIPIDQGIFKP